MKIKNLLLIGNRKSIVVKKKINEKSIKNSECLTSQEVKNFSKNLIKANLNKDMNFHIINFHKNKIKWNPKKIKKYVNDIIQESCPKLLFY